MSLGLYMDAHVPLAITRGLRRRGVDVLTAQQDGTTRLPDPELLDRATALGRILFSQDEDLIAEAVRRQRSGESLGEKWRVAHSSRSRPGPRGGGGIRICSFTTQKVPSVRA